MVRRSSEKVRISVLITEEQRARFLKYASKKGETPSQAMERLIKEYLAAQKK